MSNHTPTPWIVDKVGEDHYIIDENDNSIAVVGVEDGIAMPTYKQAEANAAHIVKCVNMYDELVSELEAMINNFKDTPREINCYTEAHINAARAVLAKAKGDT